MNLTRMVVASAIVAGGAAVGLSGPANAADPNALGTYTFEGDTMDQFVVRCTEVDPMPTSIGLNIQGFIEQVASDWRRRNLACVFERPHRGEILFRVKPRL